MPFTSAVCPLPVRIKRPWRRHFPHLLRQWKPCAKTRQFCLSPFPSSHTRHGWPLHPLPYGREESGYGETPGPAKSMCDFGIVTTSFPPALTQEPTLTGLGEGGPRVESWGWGGTPGKHRLQLCQKAASLPRPQLRPGRDRTEASEAQGNKSVGQPQFCPMDHLIRADLACLVFLKCT